MNKSHLVLFAAAALSLFPAFVSASGKHTFLTPGFKHTREENAARRAEVSAGSVRSTEGFAGLTMVGSPAIPTTAIANLTVTWSGVSNPQSTDWIALYCTNDPESVFQEWDYVSVSQGWASGSGTMSFLQARSECTLEFRLYRDPSPYTFLGRSNPVTWSGAGSGIPYQQRISYGFDPRSMMTVGWTSMNLTNDALVLVGLSSGNYNVGNFTPFSSSTYYAKDSCTAPATTEGPDAWHFPGYFYFANVTNLKANTRYFAKVFVNGVAGNELSFVTGKDKGSDVDTRFVMYGDMYISGIPGAVETSERVYNRITQENDIDFLLHVGDLSYGRGNVAIWDTWLGYIEPISSLVPYHVSIGNHGESDVFLIIFPSNVP